MNNLVYLTLTRNYDVIRECIALKDKVNDAVEELFCQVKDEGGKFNIYINGVEISVCGLLIKGEYQYEIDLLQWM